MKVLIVGEGEIAEKIAQGARQANAFVEFSPEFKDGFDLVFLDCAKAGGKETGSVALFHAKGFLEFSNPMEKAIRILQNARIVNQIFLEKKGFFKNSLDETDLERARAFGERTVRNLSGYKFQKPSEKARIKGYRK
ncbi:MAG: hypothetical protein QXR53_00735 [Candidatus Norongarragalinales archaeon]